MNTVKRITLFFFLIAIVIVLAVGGNFFLNSNKTFDFARPFVFKMVTNSAPEHFEMIVLNESNLVFVYRRHHRTSTTTEISLPKEDSDLLKSCINKFLTRSSGSKESKRILDGTQLYVLAEQGNFSNSWVYNNDYPISVKDIFNQVHSVLQKHAGTSWIESDGSPESDFWLTVAK